MSFRLPGRLSLGVAGANPRSSTTSIRSNWSRSLQSLQAEPSEGSAAQDPEEESEDRDATEGAVALNTQT
eukprot:15481651-Alexandrium_andersonii.AAC.1